MLESANLSLARAECGGMTADDGLLAITVDERTGMTAGGLMGATGGPFRGERREPFLLETLIWSDTSLFLVTRCSFSLPAAFTAGSLVSRS